jgi:polar amino acid transport system permease protein
MDLLPHLLPGLLITVQLTLAGALLAVVLALAAGIGRLSPFRVIRWIAIVYIEVFRGTSALVQLFWFYFALPLFGLRIEAMVAGILVLGLNAGAYGAEVVRGALQAVPKGQREAAHAIGLTRWQITRRVVLPQAFVTMIPPMGNILIELLKNTALVSLVTVGELTFAAQSLRADTLRTTEIFLLVLAFYFILSLIIMGCTRGIERWLGRWRTAGGFR